MSETRSRFVLLCQQSLAFGLVLAIAAPAANIVTLDIVAPSHPSPVASLPTAAGSGAPAVALGGGDAPSLVASRPVRPTVTEVALSGITPSGLTALGDGSDPAPGGTRAAARLVAADAAPQTDRLAVLSAPQPVDSLATVGVTWQHGVHLAEDAISVSVRTETDGAWSGWQTMPYHDEHGPDTGSAEARRSRPGTDPIYVGHVDEVQVKAVTDTGAAPVGMRLSLVDPGHETAPALEKPAIDTGTLHLSAADTSATGTGPASSSDTITGTTTVPTGTDVASLTAGTVTPKPMIYSRAQWGADERMRDHTALHYGEVHAGFVHHTVNANNYTAAQVPAILRGIYAFHTQSRGWSDVGYNFLVDRFGRIWEGRYGGVDRPVVGAHTLGYNDDAFAMSAIGNFDIAQPSAAMIDAYGRLFAWKLSLHGVSAGSPRQWVTKRYLPAINGHRDVGQTACPGRYLYAKIPTIRALAVKYQKSFASRNPTTDLAGSAWPDLVVRDTATKQGYVLRTGGQVGFSAGTTAASGFSGTDLVAAVGDVTGDGHADLVARTKATGSSAVYPGDGAGHFGAATSPFTSFAKLDQLTGVGDWNGDGHNDVVGRVGASMRLYVWFGNGAGLLGPTHRLLSGSWGAYTSTTGAGDLTGDGSPDLVARSADGRVWLVPGTRSGLSPARLLASGWSGEDVVAGGEDVTNDGTPDLVVRAAQTGSAWVYPGNGHGGLGTRIGPYPGFAGLRPLLSAGQLAGSSGGDLVGLDASGRLTVFTNTGRTNVEALTPTGRSFSAANLLLNVGDWNGDGHGDVVTRSAGTGTLYLYPGTGKGPLAPPVQLATGFGSVQLLAAVGDITGDGYPDLMGQPSGGSMRIYPGNGTTGLRASYVAHSAITATTQLGVGLWDGDGSPDSVFRRSDGSLVLYPGNGPGGLTGGTALGSVSNGYDWLEAADVDGDGRRDLLAREMSTGRLWVLPGTPGGFGARRLVADGLGRFDLAG